MKKRRLTLVLSLLTVTLIITLVLSRYPQETKDSIWLNILRDEGFLCQPGAAIERYSEAIAILHKHGISRESLGKDATSPDTLVMSKTERNAAIETILEGAKKDRLGVSIKLGTDFQAHVFTLDNKKCDYNDIAVLPRAIAYIAELELADGANVSPAMQLGYANLAIGVQLSRYNIDFVRALGIASKDFGLKTLETCAERKDDKQLIEQVSRMRQALEDEFAEVKTMPPPSSPSFWDFFEECIQ